VNHKGSIRVLGEREVGVGGRRTFIPFSVSLLHTYSKMHDASAMGRTWRDKGRSKALVHVITGCMRPGLQTFPLYIPPFTCEGEMQSAVSDAFCVVIGGREAWFHERCPLADAVLVSECITGGMQWNVW
jgi:hypothetical protein